MKAIRFSLPSGKEEEAHEAVVGQKGGPDEEVYTDTGSWSGSQQRLSDRGPGQETRSHQKTVSPFLCGLCCSKSPSVSVWNCDGEILPFTEILCRLENNGVQYSTVYCIM